MSWEKCKRVINNELTEVLAMHANANKCIEEAGVDIEKLKCSQAAEASDSRRRLLKSSEELLQMELEQQTIQKNIQAVDSNDEMLLQMLTHKFNKLGYNLSVSRDASNNTTLYRFNYGSRRHITTRVENGQLSLVQMCPEHPHFLRIKEFLSESQDLNGLLLTLMAGQS
ncbi:hypothetical protein ACLKA7_006336 [Drosophila subpalustris]